jgi:Cu+-exporting ATPase
MRATGVEPSCTDFDIAGVPTSIPYQGEIRMKSATAVKDHVCGMDVDTATAAGKSEYKGQTYYFCGPDCKAKFDLKPEQYLCKSGTAPKSGHGCCG